LKVSSFIGTFSSTGELAPAAIQHEVF